MDARKKKKNFEREREWEREVTYRIEEKMSNLS